MKGFTVPLLVALAGSVWAQGQPEVASHDEPVTFSSRVNLVSVPVVIRDRDGKAVGALKQEDFQVFDKSKLQVITKFSIEKSGQAAEAETWDRECARREDRRGSRAARSAGQLRRLPGG